MLTASSEVRKMMVKTKLVIIALILLFCVAQVALAEGRKPVPCQNKWEYLKGFDSVAVGVDAVDQDLASVGLDKNEIKTRVEGILKSGNVKVSPVVDVERTPKGLGYLVIHITTGAKEMNKQKVYGFNIAAEFYAWVFLGTQPDHIAMIPTWTNQMTLVLTKDQVSQVSRTAGALASFFATDFVQANANPPAAGSPSTPPAAPAK
jgi:hypothetical protein